MAAFDYKKEYKQLYQPKKEPELIQVPPMQFVAVEGKGGSKRRKWRIFQCAFAVVWDFFYD